MITDRPFAPIPSALVACDQHAQVHTNSDGTASYYCNACRALNPYWGGLDAVDMEEALIELRTDLRFARRHLKLAEENFNRLHNSAGAHRMKLFRDEVTRYINEYRRFGEPTLPNNSGK